MYDATKNPSRNLSIFVAHNIPVTFLITQLETFSKYVIYFPKEGTGLQYLKERISILCPKNIPAGSEIFS